MAKADYEFQLKVSIQYCKLKMFKGLTFFLDESSNEHSLDLRQYSGQIIYTALLLYNFRPRPDILVHGQRSSCADVRLLHSGRPWYLLAMSSLRQIVEHQSSGKLWIFPEIFTCSGYHEYDS